MIEEREITIECFSALDKLLKRTAGLKESEREELRSLLEKWKKDYLKD